MEETMKNITKSITGTIVGAAAALTLAACSSSPSTAPEASITKTSSGSNAQVRINPTDSISATPTVIVSAETEETLESWLKSNPISNMIHVDYYCDENPDFPDNPHWCLPGKIQLESGTVLSLYSGTANAILCAADQDTILYSVHLHNNIISKKWGRFYPIFHFSTDIQKSINKAEK